MKSYFDTLKEEHRKKLQRDYDDFIKRGGEPYQAKNGESGRTGFWGHSFEEINDRRKRGKARGQAIHYSKKGRGYDEAN